MKQHDTDDIRLRRLFQEMRAADSMKTPSFKSLTQAPAEKRFAFPSKRFYWSAAAAVLAAVFVLTFLPPEAVHPLDKVDTADIVSTVDEVEWKALTSWTAFSDSLVAESGTSTVHALYTGTDQWLGKDLFSMSNTKQQQEEDSL